MWQLGGGRSLARNGTGLGGLQNGPFNPKTTKFWKELKIRRGSFLVLLTFSLIWGGCGVSWRALRLLGNNFTTTKWVRVLRNLHKLLPCILSPHIWPPSPGEGWDRCGVGGHGGTGRLATRSSMASRRSMSSSYRRVQESGPGPSFPNDSSGSVAQKTARWADWAQ